jgi:hypothetical protein
MDLETANRIKAIEKHLETLILSDQTEIRATKFSNNRIFNLKKLGNGKGVRNFTLRNTGDYQIIIKDINEIIGYQESFTIISNARVANEKFEIEFGVVDPLSPAITPIREAIARYLVDKC